MEFAQPLGVGLGLVVRINNQYSHPVCTGRRTDAYMTINHTWEMSWEYWLLTRERQHGNQGICGNGKLCEQRADNMDRRVADDDVTSGSHKSITQTNHTNESHDDVMSKNGNDERCFWMLQSNSGAYGVPETG